MSTILLIGDGSAEMAGLEKVLGKYRYEVIRCSQGADALDAVGAVQGRVGADVCIIDLDASGATGLEQIAKARRISPNLPVILLSGRGSVEEYVLAKKLGIQAFVRKPIKAKNLERIIIAMATGVRAHDAQHGGGLWPALLDMRGKRAS